MRLVFAGTPVVALPSLAALIENARHDVVAVISRPDAPAGRGRVQRTSPVSALAREAGIEVLTPSHPKDAAFLERLATIAPDAAPVVAYGALVPPAALAIPTHGWVNLHFSLLPAWRGAAPVQHAVLHGDEVTGAATFRLEAGLDTGPVYGVITQDILPTDTAGAVLDRLAIAGAQLLVATLDGIEDGSLTPVPQSLVGVTTAPKLTAADVRVDWSAPAMRVDRLLRAATPNPGAWTTVRGKRVKLAPIRLDQELSGEAIEPGVIVDRGRDGVLVGTGSHPIRLREVQPEGKPMMPAMDWARGLRLLEGERFE